MALKTDRPYRGQTPEARRAERRQRLLRAGLERIGADGYAATTVKAVCAEAGLTERYFYESFADRHALLLAVYDHLIEELGGAVRDALAGAPATVEDRLRAGVGAFVRTLAADRRAARIQLFEVVGVSAELERRRRSAIELFAAVMRDEALALEPGLRALGPGVLEDACLMVAGGVNELMVGWFLADGQPPVEPVVGRLVTIAAATFDGLRGRCRG